MMLLFLASFVIGLGAFVQGAIGFGLAVVAAPVLYLLEPSLVPGPIISVALVISSLGAWRYREALNAKGIGVALVGRLPGSFLAVLLLGLGSQFMSMLIACSVLVAVLISLTSVRMLPTRKNLMIAGFFSGLFGTASSIGGPPMALLMQHEKADVVRANLSAYFTLSCVISLLFLAWGGYFGLQEVKSSLMFMPAGLLGFALAQRVAGKLKQEQFRPLLLGLCSTAAIGVLAKPMFGG